MARRIWLDRGLDLPISGAPRQEITNGPPIRSVGLVADDYVGMKPTMEVAEGDAVRLGQVLFTDKKSPGVKYTSPAAGRVASINRGAKRRFQSVVVEVEGDDRQSFASYRDQNLAMLPRETVQQSLVDSGLWTAIRRRPFGKVPAVGTTPYALFVTAIDTNPLAADPAVVIATKPTEFVAGLQALSTLCDKKLFLCKSPGIDLPGEDLECVETVEFEGPHPAGLPGTHIHFLAPVSLQRESWDIGYQDVIAVGHLMLAGELLAERVVALSGPAVRDPRLIRTMLGASLADLTAGSGAASSGVRTVSGSVLAGRKAEAPMAFLGRRHVQVTQLVEGTQREFLGWMGPGFGKFSRTAAFASAWIDRARKYAFTTSAEGSHRAIVPMGLYEKVMPLDIVPVPLLKSLCIQDTEQLQNLGALELDEEDLGLCSFVCASKNDYGSMLREALATIEKEG
jgi:Na+-transporting NADH:ubiquinone oxidoreductase subunit A